MSGACLNAGLPTAPACPATDGDMFLPALRSVRPSGCFVAPTTCARCFHDSCVSGLFFLVGGKIIEKDVLWIPQRHVNRWMDTLQVGQYEADVVSSFGWL